MTVFRAGHNFAGDTMKKDISELEQIMASEPGRSNWPDIGSFPARETKVLFCVDIGNETRLQTENERAAVIFYRSMKATGKAPIFRRYELTEEEQQRANAERRERFWEDHIYKPGGAYRTIRRKRK